MLDQDREIPIQILGHEWRLQPRQGFGPVLQKTLPKVLKNFEQRGGTFTLGPRVHTEGDSEPVTAKDYGIRILLQVLTAGPCFAAWPISTSALDIFEELHKECLASAPPQALEFKLAQSSPGLSLYLYPQAAYKGAGSDISYPVFLGFVVADGALEMAYECIQSMRLPLVLDLDETVVKAYTAAKLTKEIEEITEKMAGRDAGDRQRLQRNIDFLKEDRDLVHQFCRDGHVTIGKETIHPRNEDVCTEPGNRSVRRPVIKVPGRILTRINPHKMETTMIMHIRPGWEDLRNFIRGPPSDKGGWRPRFTVYVCTAADREYALEVWRLLDPEAELIPFDLRTTHFKAGMQKKDIYTVLNLKADPAHLNALRTAMPLAVVLDDRLDVWGDHSQPQIVQVEAFSPNGQAAAAKSATVHDAVHYDKAAEELKAVADCLKGVHRGVYYEIDVRLQAELAAAKPSFLADCEQGRLPETGTCPCVRNHFALWKQRRRDMRQARAAQKQPGGQPDLVSECTGALSMSTSRPQDSGRPQQNGALGRREQEAQSARTPGGRENGEASVDAQKGHGDQGRHSVANHGFGGNVREASSNGGSDAAPAHITEPASCKAGELAPRESGTPSLQLGGGAEAEAVPPAKLRAVGPPGLPKRLTARPREMPGAAPSSRNASTGGRAAGAAARGRALPARGFTRDVLHNSRAAAAAAQEPQPLRPARAAKLSGQQPPAAALELAQPSADPPPAQDNSGVQQKSMKEEPPDGQAAAGAPGELPQQSAGNSHRDIISLLGDDAEDASTSSAAAEPAGAAAPAPEQPEGASKQGEAATGANATGRKRKAAQEEGGPRSKKHGVGSMRDLSGRWRWRVAATADQPDQTFPLDEEDAAAEAADRDALMLAVGRGILPQLNISLAEHVKSSNPLSRRAAREVVDHFLPKVLPRMVKSQIRAAKAVMVLEDAKAIIVAEDTKAAGKQSKSRGSTPSGSPARRKRRQTSSAAS